MKVFAVNQQLLGCITTTVHYLVKGETATWNMALSLDISEWYMKASKNSPKFKYLMSNRITYLHHAWKGKDSIWLKERTMIENRWWRDERCPLSQGSRRWMVCVCGWSCPWCGADCVQGGAQQDRWCSWADEWIMMFHHSAVITCYWACMAVCLRAYGCLHRHSRACPHQSSST